MHLLMFLLTFFAFFRSFSFECFLFKLSPFVVQIKNFCSDPFCFLSFFLTMFVKDLTGCFCHCCVEGSDRWIHVCILIVYDGERCKLPAYHSLEGFQHTGIFQLSEVKLRLVRFGLLILFRRRWKVIISKSWSLPMSAPAKLCGMALFTPDRKRFLIRM